MTGSIKDSNHTVIYDDDCHICQSMVKRARGRMLKDRIKFTPSRNFIKANSKYSIDSNTLNKSVVFINDGVVYTGTEAVIGIARQMPGMWKVAGWVISIPGIKQIFDLGYRIFARHRHAVSKLISDGRPRRDL